MVGTAMKRFLVAFLVLLVPVVAFGQAFPTRPINCTIVSAPGQIGDVTTRMLGGKAEKVLGQPFVYLNNNAAGGTVSFDAVAKAKPDGYSILTAASGNLIWIPFTRHVNYKLEDFAAVAQNGLLETGVVVKADSPWKTFKELVAYAKANPGKVSYAVTSANVPMDIAMQYVAKQEGVRWTAVPTPGADPNTFLLGGHVAAYSGATSWLPHVRSGAFRLLAIHSAKRMKEFPDVPTFVELGYDFIHETQNLILAPKGTPEPVLGKLDEAIRKGLQDKEVIDLYTKLGVPVFYRSHTELAKFLPESRDMVERVMKKLGITPEPEKK